MRLYSLAYILFFFQFTNGQLDYKPSIVILDPFLKRYDSALTKEIQNFNIEKKETENGNLNRFGGISTKHQKIDSSIQEFKKNLNYFSMLTLDISTGCMLALFGKSEDIFSIPSHDTSAGNLNSLKMIAEKHKVIWVVNPKEFEIQMLDSNKVVKVRFQIYNLKLNEILLEKVIVAESKKLNRYLLCQSDSLECCLSSISSDANSLILAVIGINSEHW